MEQSHSIKNSELFIKNEELDTIECFVATADIRRPKKRAKVEDLSTITLGYVKSKMPNQMGENQRLRVLFDSGCSATLVNKKFLRNWEKKPVKDIKWSTKAGSFTTKRKCKLEFSLPAFHENKIISCTAYVDESHEAAGSYDMIIGRDLMHSLGINLLFDSAQITWDHASVSMQPSQRLKEDWVEELEQEILFAHDPETTDAERIQGIIDSKYCAADLQKIVDECTHLTQSERDELLKLLQKFEHLFDGTLGTWKTEPIDLELKDPNVKPYHAKPYPVPFSQEKKLRAELERMCQYGIVRKNNNSQWACPMFTIAKPDGSLRSLADLREVNKVIKRKPFPLPKIQDMLQKLEGFWYATSLDLNMGYYHILLTPWSSSLCTIVLPWGKYEYLRLPMGLCNSPDIFQEKMSNLMAGLEFARAYLDDLLVISTEVGFSNHLNKLEQVLNRLSEAGLKINAVKSFFCRTNLEYLGYNISREGIRPNQKKVDAIQQIKSPTTRKQLRRFIGMVNYYRDMWPLRSHLLAPLSALTSSTVKWKWEPVHQTAFEQMKTLIATDTLLNYPDFTKEFDIHTDASLLQLGACISQGGKPVAFYSRKLQPAQTRYTTTERELLSIVETLKEFRNILLGQKIKVHTDHENLTYKTFNSDRVMRWRLYIEEYSPELQYIKGTSNVVADALSRLEREDGVREDTKESFLALKDCFVAAPPVDYHPLNYQHLAKAQLADKSLMKKAQQKDTVYLPREFHGGGKVISLICFHGKIVVPARLTTHVIRWYHTTLIHPGIERTEATISQHLFWNDMRTHITRYCNLCPTCQYNKKRFKKYGHLPEKVAECVPWDVLCVDSIGPYKIRTGPKKNDFITVQCITMIDPATSWFEICEKSNKKGMTSANIVEQQWLTRYPWPTQVICDRGTEFNNQEFKDMLKNDYGVTTKVISVRNPQANSIIERVHQVLGNMIRTFELEKNYIDEDDPWSGILSAAAFAIRSTYHTTLKSTPGQLVFGRDMVLNSTHEANWEYIRKRKQQIIAKNNKAENAKRIPHTYAIGDRVLLRRGTDNKYETPYRGPYIILKVNDNGTVRMKVRNVEDTYNIRQITPYIDAQNIDH